MSLDVYLEAETTTAPHGSGIFVRENGETKEISREEWDRKFPGREPVILDTSDDNIVYHRNITHNLNQMASIAGIYVHLWRPDEIGITQAKQLIAPLTVGLEMMRKEPERFRLYNPENGWGNYEGLVAFVSDYLQACLDNPEATVRASR